MAQWVAGLNVHARQPDNLSLLPRGQAKVDNSTVILSPPRAHCGVHSSPPVSLPPSPHTTHLKKKLLKNKRKGWPGHCHCACQILSGRWSSHSGKLGLGVSSLPPFLCHQQPQAAFRVMQCGSASQLSYLVCFQILRMPDHTT